MKLQIDFDKKTIKIENDVNLGLLIDKLKIHLPEYKEYKLLMNTKIEYITLPNYNYRYPYITWSSTSTAPINKDSYNSGILNVKLDE